MTGYIREVVRRAPNYELILIQWPAGSITPIHDHGALKGVRMEGEVIILEGELEETYFNKDGNLVTRILSADMRVSINDATIHVVRNSGERDALAVHIFRYPDKQFERPNMEDFMTTFDAWPFP